MGAAAVISSQTLGYAYDGMGNRTATTQGTHTTAYPSTNALNQYEGITHPRALEVSGSIGSGFTPEYPSDLAPWVCRSR